MSSPESREVWAGVKKEKVTVQQFPEASVSENQFLVSYGSAAFTNRIE